MATPRLETARLILEPLASRCPARAKAAINTREEWRNLNH